MRFNRIAISLTVIISILAIIFACTPVLDSIALPAFTTKETITEPTTAPELECTPSPSPAVETTTTFATEVTREPVITEKPKYIINDNIPTKEFTDGPILKIHQIKAGCADAYLIQSGEINIMVDGANIESDSGGKGIRDRIIKYLKEEGVSTLDAYIATHWHQDHVKNMNAILREYGSSATLVYGYSPKCSDIYTIPAGKGQYVQMLDGDVITYGDITIKCMGPYTIDTNKDSENINSLNFLLTFGEIRCFFTGDYVHSQVLKSYKDELKNIDVYKMAHHGLKVSKYSGSEDVLSHMNPDIILVPANSSNPTRSLVTKLGISTKVYDNGGNKYNVVLTTNGKEIRINTVV